VLCAIWDSKNESIGGRRGEKWRTAAGGRGRGRGRRRGGGGGEEEEEDEEELEDKDEEKEEQGEEETKRVKFCRLATFIAACVN